MVRLTHDPIGEETTDTDRPDRIVPEPPHDRHERALTRDHERIRGLVGHLAVGTRVSFQRPGEKRRWGVIASVPAEFCYRVKADDRHGDWHLDAGLVAVLWASHGVAVKTNRQAKGPEPAKEGTVNDNGSGHTDGTSHAVGEGDLFVAEHTTVGVGRDRPAVDQPQTGERAC